VEKTSRNSADLRKSLRDTISACKATVGISVIELETGDTLSVNNHIDFAMQSVYKFPLALQILQEVQEGRLSLNRQILLDEEILKRYSWSPLKKQNPGSTIKMSIDSLLMYMISYSDNLACDKLFQVVGGPGTTNDFIHKTGFPQIQIKYTEAEIGADIKRAYLNTSRPSDMTALLKAFYERKIINEAGTRHLLHYMTNDSTSHKRMRGKLPQDVAVAHKTGTANIGDEFINACNDVGIIAMPGGKHLAVAVFVMNGTMTYADAERLIATVTRQIYDFYK